MGGGRISEIQGRQAMLLRHCPSCYEILVTGLIQTSEDFLVLLI